MTFLKKTMFGSAAALVAVAGAQAADLPTKKAAPVAQYVKICNVGGATGWTLPGSDTCVKLSGYITAQFEGGNLSTQYNQGGYASVYNAYIGSGGTDAATIAHLAAGVVATGGAIAGGVASGGLSSQRVLLAGSQTQGNATWNRNLTGWSTRANVALDFASNTAYGPLIGHIDVKAENGNGFDSTSTLTYLDTGYLTWAGITAGKAPSFFSFTGGGDNWANFFSPDQKGFNEPDLLAYTASFGGGFSATISAQSAGTNGAGSGSGAQFAPPGGTFAGQRWPDLVAALHVTQGWGEAQLSGVLHQVNVSYNGLYGASGVGGCGVAGVAVNCNASQNKMGWGLDAGVKVNLPSFGPGDNVLITGAYTKNAVWFSGLPEAMWGENGQVNGNGQAMPLYDTYFNQSTNQWSTPTAWSVSAQLEHYWTPQFYTVLLGGVGGLKWSNMGGGCYLLGYGCGVAQAVQGPLSPSAITWVAGADIGWIPVTNLNFDLELMYQAVNQQKPSGFLGTVTNIGGVGGAVFAPGAWEGNSNGFAGRLRITRYF